MEKKEGARPESFWKTDSSLLSGVCPCGTNYFSTKVQNLTAETRYSVRVCLNMIENSVSSHYMRVLQKKRSPELQLPVNFILLPSLRYAFFFFFKNLLYE